jgi:prepilin-type N-terminal cleavage/methylation domain-containing protein
MKRPVVRAHPTAGFTLVETLVAVTIVSLIMGATFMALTNATRLSENARLMTGVNTNLRNAMDSIVRDLSQAGRSLPGLRRVGVPNGAGSNQINRPVPPTSGAGHTPGGMTLFRAAVGLPAVSVGYQAGDNNTDVLTIITADSTFENIGVTAATANGSGATITVVASRPLVVTNGGPNNIQVGDLIDVRNAGADVLLSVSAISGQTLTFQPGASDGMGLNQFALGLAGSGSTVIGAAPPVASVSLTRIKFISYYVFTDNPNDPRYPRLVRRVNWGTPGTVAFGVDTFTITYDLATTDLAFTGVSMNNNDIVTGNGACRDTVNSVNRVCSEDWVRKISVVLSVHSLDRTAQQAYYSNTIYSEIAIRSLAFQDRFR